MVIPWKLFSVADDVIRLLQVSDLHLQQEPDQLMRGENVEQRFLKVLQALQQESADLLLLTGDLSHHAPAAYPRLCEYLRSLNYPACWIPGNHDLPGEMYAQAQPDLGRKVVELGNWKILLLDSTAQPDGRGSGALSEPELDFLSTELEESSPQQHVLIVLHHNPVSVSSRWQDEIGLANADQFWSLLDCYPQVRGVLFGHVHQSWHLQRGSVQLFSVPATAPQFKRACDSAEIETDPALSGPAYGRYQLAETGEILTEIVRLPA